jgi:hypothetical protein
MLGHLNVRAWEIESGAFCKESFLSQEYNLKPNFFYCVYDLMHMLGLLVSIINFRENIPFNS